MADPARIVLGHELRASLRSFTWWAASVGALVAMTCALQPSLAEGPLAAKLESLPIGVRKVFGLEIVDFRRPAAYLATNFTVVAITSAVFASLLGAASIAKEETLRTAEMLYSLPVSRARIVLGKLGMVATYTLAYPVVLAAIALAVLGSVADRPLEAVLIVELFIGSAAIGVCFAGIGVLASTLVRDKRAATTTAVGIALGSYFLGAISAIAEPAAPLRFASPHKLAEPMKILADGVDPVRLLGLVAIGVAAAALGVARYRVQDIHA
jgi:ABC-2 type transport system permease protein